MSDFDSNPFADPDLNNPFEDPSVTQVTRNVPPGLDEYNPFSDSRTSILLDKLSNCGISSGWISSLTGLNKSIPVGIMMIIIAALFTASAVISLVMFKKVHGLYRTTGASFEKAQQEFATGVMSNKTVQTAAANAASTAATSAAQNAFKGNRM
ncbi:secretory carrier-associated membrane protein 1-like [Aegotheles albertisi]